nr:hypothetical protein [Tanacetum cinerariifolium]
HVIDELVYKKLEDNLVRAATTASSLEAEQDSGNINKTQSKETSNESSSQRTDSGGGTRVGSFGDEDNLGEDASNQERRIDDIDQDGDITLVNVQDDAEMFDANKDLGGEEVFVEQVVVGDKEETDEDKGKGIMIEEPMKLKKKDQIKLDEEAALRLQAEFNEEERLIDVDYQLAERVQAQESELVQGKEQRAREELIQESSKKQKVDDDKEIAKLKQLMEIIPIEEEVEINAIPLAVKSPNIVDWKIHKEGKKSYYQIKRANGKTQMYMVFCKMHESFNREDLEDLYKLVKGRYESTRPVEDLDLLLWGDLKTTFKPHIEDAIWKKQQGYKVLEW